MRAECALSAEKAPSEVYARLEKSIIDTMASGLISAAVRAFDKPEIDGANEEPIRRLERSVGEPSLDIAKPAVLRARSLCREMRQHATGADPVGDDAYRLLTEFAIMIFGLERAEGGEPNPLRPALGNGPQRQDGIEPRPLGFPE